MGHVRWQGCALSAVIMVLVALLSGCPSQEPEQIVMSEPPPEAAQVDEPVAEEPDEAGAAALTAFEFTETPSVEMIPAGPIAGLMRGEAWTAQTVRVERNAPDRFRMQISNGELSDPEKITSMILNDDGWRFRFAVTEGSKTTLQWAIDDEKTFDDEHAYYYYEQGDDKPTMSVNGPWGAALEITEWTQHESPSDRNVIGTMKGRLALVMRDRDKSWAVGEFEALVYKW